MARTGMHGWPLITIRRFEQRASDNGLREI